MKAGILTFHRAYNYEAILQAFALQKAICKIGCDSEIIDNLSVEKRKIARLFYHDNNLGIKGNISKFFKDFYRSEKNKEFDFFMHDHTRLGENTYSTFEEMGKNAPTYFINVILSRYAGLGTALSRLKTGAAVLSMNTISLFGVGNITTDFGFVFIGFQYGLIILLIYIIANTVLMKVFFKNKYYIEFFIMLIYAVYTMVESYSASILMNASLILLSLLLYSNNRSDYFQGGESV